MCRSTSITKNCCLVIVLGMILIMTGSCVSQKSKLLKRKQQDILESYRLQVSEIIDDPERARQLNELAEDLYRQMLVYTKVLHKMFDELDSLNKTYDTERHELEAAFHAINNHRIRMRENIFTSRVKALSLTTPEEWQELMNRRKTLMDLIQETPGLL